MTTIHETNASLPNVTPPSAATILADISARTGLTGWDLADYLSDLSYFTAQAGAQAIRETRDRG